MKKLLIIFLVGFYTFANAAEKKGKAHDHDHKAESPKAEVAKEKAAAKKDHDQEAHKEDDHGEADEHDDHGAHGGHGGHEEGEENSQVGPNKGILEANDDLGFKLSPEAEKNFGIQKIKLGSESVIELPKEAILKAVSEVNIYRVRDGFYKRIDFVKINQTDSKVSIKSKDLKAGDEIVIRGLGFLRIAELAAFGGAPEGHSH